MPSVFLLIFFATCCIGSTLILGISAAAYHLNITPQSSLRHNLESAIAAESGARTLVMGTSRTRNLTATSPAFTSDHHPVLRYENKADSPTNMYLRLQHVLAFSPELRTVILCPDFFACNIHNTVCQDVVKHCFAHGDISLDRFKLERYLSLIISTQNLIPNIKALYNYCKSDHSTPQYHPPALTSKEKFKYMSEHFAEDNLFPLPAKSFDLGLSKPNNHFDSFRETLRLCHARGLDVRILILPHHAYLLEMHSALGLDHSYATWLQTLTDLNTSVASEYNQAPYPLINFAMYSKYTTERVTDSLANPMQWYGDTSHFSDALGDRILNVALKLPPESDWYSYMTSESVSDHLQQLKAAQPSYRAQHPEAAQAIHDVYTAWITLNTQLGIRHDFAAHSDPFYRTYARH